MKILLIDDDEQVLDSLRQMLEAQGHEADSVGNADDALPMVKDGGYDFVLVDFKMPHHDGIWFMKNADIPKSTKVLLLTAYVNREVINEMFKLGARGYLIKPLNGDEIRDHLDFHSSQREHDTE